MLRADGSGQVNEIGSVTNDKFRFTVRHAAHDHVGEILPSFRSILAKIIQGRGVRTGGRTKTCHSQKKPPSIALCITFVSSDHLIIFALCLSTNVGLNSGRDARAQVKARVKVTPSQAENPVRTAPHVTSTATICRDQSRKVA